MFRALKNGRIVLDTRASHLYHDRESGPSIDIGGREATNIMIFEATASGCFLLTEQFDNLGEFFGPPG